VSNVKVWMFADTTRVGSVVRESSFPTLNLAEDGVAGNAAGTRRRATCKGKRSVIAILGYVVVLISLYMNVDFL
jgi:hypothetical protein